MNKHDNSDALDTLYQKRKRRYASPNSIKEEMLEHLNTNAKQIKPWWKIDLSSYFKISALAVSVVFALIFVNIQFINQHQASEPMLASMPPQYTSIELHVLDANSVVRKSSRAAFTHMPAPASSMMQAEADLQSELADESSSEMASVQASKKLTTHKEIEVGAQQRKIKYQQAYLSYQEKQQHLQIHHKTYARVIQNEEGLSLVTCEQALIKISAEVLSLIKKSDTKQSLDITQGQLLTLSFDENGHIIEMQNQQEKTQC